MSETESKANLYFRPRYRKSPLFEATRRAGCKGYGIYNHMYLPDYYDDPVEEYWHLSNGAARPPYRRRKAIIERATYSA